MRIVLEGKTAHASMPQDGTSPMAAMARLTPALTKLGVAGAPLDDRFRLVTVTHAKLGAPAFGAPGRGEIWATLRTLKDEMMNGLVARAEALVAAEARSGRLGHAFSYEDIFQHCENHPEAVAVLRRTLNAEGVVPRPGDPMYPSEDFGNFAKVCRSAGFFVGAGVQHPRLQPGLRLSGRLDPDRCASVPARRR